MRFTERQRLMMGTNLARDRAEALLSELLDTSRAVQIHNVVKTRPVMSCDKSLDQAISSTRLLIESLNDSLEKAEADLGNIDLSYLDHAIDSDNASDDALFELDSWIEEIEIELRSHTDGVRPVDRLETGESSDNRSAQSHGLRPSPGRPDPAAELDT